MRIISFSGKPANYAKINEKVSRSAQPEFNDFKWLKNDGVTDVVNFRTMYVSAIDFDEAERLKSLGVNYHNIPTYTRNPQKELIVDFVKLVDKITENGGKVHIHCKAGADRTGMYAFFYKCLKNIGSVSDNILEWKQMGHDFKKYPDLIPWALDCLKKIKK